MQTSEILVADTLSPSKVQTGCYVQHETGTLSFALTCLSKQTAFIVIFFVYPVQA